jgi:hypothetical protein
MLNSITIDKIRDLGFLRTTLYGTFAVLALAANCAGAPGTIAFKGITTSASAPGGFVYDGTRMWVADASKGLCRMDPAGGGGGFTLSNCVLPATNSLTVKAVLGQPVYDAVTHFVYVPDMSTSSKGIWRYLSNGSTFSTPFNLAATLGLGAQRPGSVTLGDDGNVYASMTANNSFVRVNLPATATQTVDKMGTTLSGSPARGLAFVGPQLWYADTDGEVIVPGASLCATKCSGTLNTQVGVPSPLSMTWDAVNSLLYIGTSFGVFQHNRLTGQTVLYSKHSASGLFTNVNGLGLDTAGNLYLVDDPTASQVVGGATAYSVPVNSLPDGLGNLGSPAPTIPPTLSAAPAFANNALLYATGLTTPAGAIFMGTHVWVSDAALGFCKVDPTKTPNLTACATLPAGFVPGQPAYDKVSNQVFLINTAAALATDVAIVRLTFVPATETLAAVATVTTVATVVTNGALTAAAAGSTAPTALAYGPDQQLYVAMAGTSQILRVTTPASLQHKVTFIGAIFDPGSVNIAFHNSDLWGVEKASASIIYGATFCLGNCTSLFFPQAMQLPPLSVTSDGPNVYIGDQQKVMMFDPIANVYSTMADTGTIAGAPQVFTSISGLASDGLGHIFAADAGPMWQIGASTALPTITSIAPFQAPEGSTKAVTITGTGFNATSLVVSTCASGAIVPGNVAVVSLTQITATFTVNPVGPLGACNITVNTTAGASAASAGSSFTVLIGPPALTSITPLSGFRGRTIPVSIVGANMGSGTIDPIPGVSVTSPVVDATGTLTTANFVISPIATLGPQNVTMTTPSGTSNFLTFTINAAPPVLTIVAPASGVAGSTLALTLTGTDLFQATVNPPLGFTISGVPVVTATSINVTFLVASTVAAGPQSITVTGPGGTSNAVAFKILPALLSITPVTARAGAVTTVSMLGTSLAGVTAVNAGANITVTNIAASASLVTATFTSALNAPLGAQSVTVTDVNGSSNALTFSLTAPIPVLNTVAPVTGGTGATIAITLNGTGLLGSTLTLPAGVTLNGTPVISFTTITASVTIAGNAPLGLQTISATTAGGTSNTVNFTVFALAPLLNTIAPTTSAAGATVTATLTGTGLTGTTSVNTAVGGGITVNPGFTVNAGGTQLTATFVIALNAVTQQISVTNTNGTSNPVTFGIVPTLSSISPASKPAGLSVLVTLTGTSLIGATSIGTGTAGIAFSGLTVVSSTQITATFTIAAAAVQGNHLITVTTPGGTTTAVVNFNVLPPPPTITSINSPFTRSGAVNNQGASIGGTSFTGAADITAVQVFLNGVSVPLVISANPVAGKIIVSSGSFATQATQLKWNQTIPTSEPASSGTQVYTMTVTTPSGTTAPFGFTVQ